MFKTTANKDWALDSYTVNSSNVESQTMFLHIFVHFLLVSFTTTINISSILKNTVEKFNAQLLADRS